LLFVLVIAAVFSVITGCKKNSSPAAPAATNIPNAAQTAVAAVIYTDLAQVPAGTFTQTDTDSHSFSHTISAFKIGKYLVTYDLWYTVYQWAIANGYTFANAGTEGNDGIAGAVTTTAKYEPVTTINWRDAIVWCNAYSRMAGLTPVYCSDAGFTTEIKSSADGSYESIANTTAGSFDNPYVNWSANGYRLTTEGEYQYAASYIDGTNWTPYNYASGATAYCADATATRLVAWYATTSGSATQNVGGKTANALGIYDMSGNVFELCWDWYADYPTTASTNYKGPASGYFRVLRGGSYRKDLSPLQVGYRNYSPEESPFNEDKSYGFRIARTY
jgi:formylglycine-generating enzyme required for sulfatase activity